MPGFEAGQPFPFQRAEKGGVVCGKVSAGKGAVFVQGQTLGHAQAQHDQLFGLFREAQFLLPGRGRPPRTSSSHAERSAGRLQRYFPTVLTAEGPRPR